MSAQMTDQRILELLRLRRKIDSELTRLTKIETKSGKRRTRSKFDVPECGSETAWQRHRYYDEPQDDACKAAHRAHNRAQYARTIVRAAS